MLLTIIVVSYNTQDLTLQALAAVIADLKKSKKLSTSCEIIVVDNHSTDDSVAAIRKQLAQSTIPFEVIVNQTNQGFAQANNQGIAQAKGEYILLLNSDTVVKPGALQELVKTFEQHPIKEAVAHLSPKNNLYDRLGIQAATLLNPDGSEQRQGGSFPNLVSIMVHMLFLDDLPLIGRFLPSTQHTGRNKLLSLTDQPYPKDWVGGTAMMIRRKVFAETGPLDPQIFMYGEDVEFCLRAKHHHWDIAINPRAKITHYSSASSSSSNAIVGEFKSYLYIWSKHKPLWQLPFLKSILRTGALLRLVIFGIIAQNSQKKRAYQQVLRQI